MFDQLAFRAVKVQLLELLHSPRLILVQVAIESGFGDTAQLLDLFVLQLLAPQVDYFHLPLHVGVRMVEPPIAQRLYLFCAKLQLEHLRASRSKLNSLLPSNFYQKFSKVSSCPARSIKQVMHLAELIIFITSL